MRRFGKIQFARQQRGLPFAGEGVDGVFEGEGDKAIRRAIGGLRGDGDGFRLAHIARGHDGFQSHARMFIGRAAAQKCKRIFQAVVPAPNHARGISARTIILRGEQALEQGAVHHFVRFKHADGFEQFGFERGVGGLQRVDPLLRGGYGLGLRQIHQAQLGQFARAAQGRGKLIT